MKKYDLHIHTGLSSDSTTTIEQAVGTAKTKGIETIALTNHAPEIAGRAWYSDKAAILKYKEEAKHAGKQAGISKKMPAPEKT